MARYDHTRVTRGVPIEPLFRIGKRGKMGRMAFMEGQQVRVKRGQGIGTVDRKLSSFQDMYVIRMDGNHTPPRKLAHESDLELLLRVDERQSSGQNSAARSGLKN